MIDNEIIKALKCCSLDVRENTCPKCAFYKKHRCSTLMLNAVSDLIKRQKSEIERLKKKNTILSKNADTAFQDGLNENRDLFKKEVEPEIRNEAIREFAERLKKYLCLDLREGISVVTTDNINKIVKEMTRSEDE